jgi:high-affinity nickel permease
VATGSVATVLMFIEIGVPMQLSSAVVLGVRHAADADRLAAIGVF